MGFLLNMRILSIQEKIHSSFIFFLSSFTFFLYVLLACPYPQGEPGVSPLHRTGLPRRINGTTWEAEGWRNVDS